MAMRRRSFLLFVSALLLSAGALAQELTFGKWSTGRTSSGSGFYAITVNDSGHVLGRYCLESSSCVYLLGIATACTKGDRYPVLVNATTGAKTLEVYCNGPLEGGNKYQYVFSAFDEVDQLLRRGTRVGFAIPIDGIDFTIVPFSLIGSREAIAVMTAAWTSSTTPAPARGRTTRDERL
jgi:hypothetical protein